MSDHAGRTFRYHLHGIVVETRGFELDARPAPDAHTPADVVVSIAADGPVPAVAEVPAGRLLGFVHHPDDSELTVVAVPARTATMAEDVEIHYHGYATARVSTHRRLVLLRFAEPSFRPLAPVLVGGGILAVVSTLLGHPVLHASAVTVDTGDGRRAVAVVGSSGMGKSTVATLAVRDGAKLLCDDVLRLDVDGETVMAWPGATATRLRDTARSLAEGTPQLTSMSADGRHVVALPLSPNEPTPLAAVVIPVPDRDAKQVRCEPLTGLDAFLGLAAFPRLAGWRDPDTAAQHHTLIGEVANRVAIVRVTVPWGPPFRPGVGRAVVEQALRAARS